MTTNKGKAFTLRSPLKLREVRNASAGRPPTSSNLTLTYHEAFIYLNTERFFFRVKKNLTKTPCKVRIDSTLKTLQIERDRGGLCLMVEEIESVEFGFSESLGARLVSNDEYGLRIITQRKTIELCTYLKNQRDYWTVSMRMLVETSKEWRNNEGVRSYIDLLRKVQLDNEELESLKNMQGVYENKLKSGEEEQESIEKEIVIETVNRLILKIEKDETDLIVHTKNQIQEEIGISYRGIVEKNEEIEKLSKNVKVLELKIIRDSMNYHSYQSKVWKRVLAFFTYQDLLKLQQVSKFFNKAVSTHLKDADQWADLCSYTLHPRTLSWKFYLSTFYSAEIPQVLSEIDCEHLMKIRTEIPKTVPDDRDKVEEILILFSATKPEIGYSEGMELIAHFLYKVFNKIDTVISALLSLIKFPYLLGEIWNPQTDRISIIIFQIKFLVKMKLPILYKHFKDLGLNIADVVTRWIKNLFLCLDYNTNQNSLEEIWDLFIVHAWRGFVSACLSILDYSQHSVLGNTKEETLEYYQSPEVPGSVSKFMVSQRILNDLEKVFYMRNLNY